MKPVRIDFAAPSLRRTLFHTHPLVWLLCLAALAACCYAGWTGWQLLVQQRSNDERLAALGARRVASASAAAPAVRPAISEAQAVAVNGAVRRLNLPWRALREAVAGATTPAIAVVALEPDAHKHSMRITAEAKNADDMIDYVEQLKHQELFNAVTLTRHEINELDPNKPMRFQIEAQWSAP